MDKVDPRKRCRIFNIQNLVKKSNIEDTTPFVIRGEIGIHRILSPELDYIPGSSAEGP
jgi:hypothetical protein